MTVRTLRAACGEGAGAADVGGGVLGADEAAMLMLVDVSGASSEGGESAASVLGCRVTVMINASAAPTRVALSMARPIRIFMILKTYQDPDFFPPPRINSEPSRLLQLIHSFSHQE
ncbi:MAG TPA: hypothetical protein VFG87_00350 [Amycolatopsis sp.]|jgi:hypothetical protein|nr:hypothetical protein [Amycolatopsis sp.]